MIQEPPESSSLAYWKQLYLSCLLPGSGLPWELFLELVGSHGPWAAPSCLLSQCRTEILSLFAKCHSLQSIHQEKGSIRSIKAFDINRTKETWREVLFPASLVISLPLLSQPVLQATDTSKLLCTSMAVDFSRIFWEGKKLKHLI